MTLHIHYSYQCPACGAHYIPYNEDVLCPKCGTKNNETYDYISEAVASLQFNLHSYGKYTPLAWFSGSLCDHILLLLFPIFDNYNKDSGKQSFSEMSGKWLEAMQWADQQYLCAHVHEIAVKIYDKLQEQDKEKYCRNIS